MDQLSVAQAAQHELLAVLVLQLLLIVIEEVVGRGARLSNQRHVARVLHHLQY